MIELARYCLTHGRHWQRYRDGVPEPVPSRSLINIVFDKLPQSNAERYTELGRIVDTWTHSERIHGYRQTRAESSAVDDYEDLYSAYLEDAKDEDGIPIRAHFQDYAAKLAVGPYPYFSRLSKC
ncbi:MAG: hypothetical protein R3E34_10090 [Rhodocyclaceae bacterium]